MVTVRLLACAALVAGVLVLGTRPGVTSTPQATADPVPQAVSADGERFVPAGTGRLLRNRRPQWIPVHAPGLARARYVRLTALEGFGSTAGVAELNAYERTAAKRQQATRDPSRGR